MRDWELTVTQACGLRWADTPEPARARSALLLADTVGAMLAGAGRPDIGRLEGAVLAWRGADRTERSAVLLTRDERVDAEEAAFVYGTAATWLELDEAAAAGVHAAAHVVAAVLAVAQAHRLPGPRLIDGLLAGYEVAAALAEQFPVTYPDHPHAGIAGVGAAAGVAVALGRDPLPAARIAGTLPILPTWDACFEGATARHAFAGAAAAAAVRATALAEAGFTGSAGAVETLFGAIAGEARERPAPASLDAPRLLASTVKHHAACLTCHTAIEAALRIGPLDPDAIERVTVHTVADVADKVDRQPVGNELSTKFSLPYAVAAALVHRRSDPSAFIPDARTIALARRVAVEVDPALPTEGHAMPARVAVRLGGKEHVEEVLHAQGSAARPAGAEDVRAKFLRNVDDPALLEALLAVERRADCGDLLVTAARTIPAGLGEDQLLQHAVRLAHENARAGQRPFAAVIVRDGEVIGTGVNTALRDADPSAHAEVNAIRAACRRLGTEDLTGAEIFTNCEPCPVCHTLSTLVGIRRMIYAAPKEDPARVGFALGPESETQQAALRRDGRDVVELMPTPGSGAPFAAWAALTGRGADAAA